MIAIRNGIIHDAVSTEPYQNDILIDNGRIAAIGKNLSAPEEFDAAGMDVYPGFIDAHTHIGMFGFSGQMTKDDVEEYDRCTPQHRGIDCINPLEPTFRSALLAGVTTVCVGPGSVGCISGTHLALKTAGYRVDDMIVRNPVAMKIAFGENPKNHLKDKLTTRMSISSAIRDILYKAMDYKARKEAAGECVLKRPAYDPKLEALIPVLNKEIPLKAHCQRLDDIFSAIRLAKELDLDLTLEHAHEAGFCPEVFAAEGYPIAVGPFICQPQKDEGRNRDEKLAIALIEAGCQVSVMTDSPIIEERLLPLCAGLLQREGLDEFNALKTITINPAKHLGIADRVGSIEKGKDADLVICRGNPMSMCVKPIAVFVNGQRV